MAHSIAVPIIIVVVDSANVVIVLTKSVQIIKRLMNIFSVDFVVYSRLYFKPILEFWNSSVGCLPIDVIVGSVYFIRILCGIFSFPFFINVEICKSALKSKYSKICTNRLRKESKETKLCLL